MRKVIWIITALLFKCGFVRAQNVIRNFGFEDVDPKEYTVGWDLTPGAKAAIRKTDATVAHSGKCSYLLAIADSTKDRTAAGISTVIYARNLATKRMLTVSVFIKTEDLKDGGGALLGIEEYDPKNIVIAKASTLGQNWTGTSDWRMQSVELKINPDVKYIRIGLFMQGTGKAWFDDLNVLIDDQPLGNDLVLK